MNKEETKKVLGIIIASYPTYKPENMQVTLNVWNEMLKDYDYGMVCAGLKAFISTDTKGFAPSIGQLIDYIAKLTKEDEPNELEAWTMVKKALCDSTYHSQERFDELPELVQKAVGSASQLRSWGMDMAFNESVAQSNFMKVYKQVVARNNDSLKLSADVTKLLKSRELNLLEGGANG